MKRHWVLHIFIAFRVLPILQFFDRQKFLLFSKKMLDNNSFYCYNKRVVSRGNKNMGV